MPSLSLHVANTALLLLVIAHVRCVHNYSIQGDHNVHVIERATGKLVKTLTGHPRTCWSVVFHPKNPKLIASADLSGEVRVWCVDTGEGPVWRRVRGVVERETNR